MQQVRGRRNDFLQAWRAARLSRSGTVVSLRSRSAAQKVAATSPRNGMARALREDLDEGYPDGRKPSGRDDVTLRRF